MKSTSRRMIALAAVLAVFALPSAAFAANETFATATEIGIPHAKTYTNEGATLANDAGEPNTAGDGTNGCLADDTVGEDGQKVAKTVWFKFTGNGLPVTLSTKLSDVDTVLFVYGDTDGTVGGLAPVTCNDDIDTDDQRYQS
jgi:hypothetical protein